MIALYQRSIEWEKEYWQTFFFYPILFGTSDRNKIYEKVYSIPTEDWDRLEISIKKIKKPKEEALHKIDIETTAWSDEED